MNVPRSGATLGFWFGQGDRIKMKDACRDQIAFVYSCEQAKRQHYIGSTVDLNRRIYEHRNGRTAFLTIRLSCSSITKHSIKPGCPRSRIAIEMAAGMEAN